MANEKTPVVWDDTTKKHRPLGTGEKMGGLDASSILSSDSGNLLQSGSDGLAFISGSGIADPRADNLLETSSGGKLQVTVDRIAEWLDGHPQDAAIIADAINVVSGDSGNIIVEGTDKGAYLSKTAIANAVNGMTDAQKNALADAIAARIAADIADGQTIVASGGKLHADPTNATVAQKKAINNALSSSTGGLVVNNSTGLLEVDFENMPTDKFEKMLKSMKMQIPLDSNRQLYVNGSTGNNAAAEADDTTPFKTIQACVDYATKNFAVGQSNVYINVEGGMTYTEQVTLPMFTRTSGVMVLRARQDANPPTITNPAAAKVGTPVSVTGGSWIIHRVNVTGVFSDPADGNNHFPACVSADGGATSVTIRGCDLVSSYNSGTPAGGRDITLRHIAAYNGATVTLGVTAGYQNKLTLTKGSATGADFLHSERFSRISIPSGNTDNPEGSTVDMYEIVCSGACTYFVRVGVSSQIYIVGGGRHYQSFVVASGGSVTGAQYYIVNGSGVSAPSGGFPGSSSGNYLDNDPDTGTYCWYKTN